MPSYSDISQITVSVTFDRTTIETYKDNSSPTPKSLRNVRSLTTITDLTGTNRDIVLAEIMGSGVPASSGTKYSGFGPGSRYLNLASGIWYTKTSEVGAADAWAAQ